MLLLFPWVFSGFFVSTHVCFSLRLLDAFAIQRLSLKGLRAHLCVVAFWICVGLGRDWVCAVFAKRLRDRAVPDRCAQPVHAAHSQNECPEKSYCGACCNGRSCRLQRLRLRPSWTGGRCVEAIGR